MYNRRTFLKQSMMAGAGLWLSKPYEALAGEEDIAKVLTILHTNDVHSRLDPFPMDGGKYQGLGGVVAREKKIREIRQEAAQILLLDAGDMFQGTPYFNYYKGKLEIEVMNTLGYDAGTLGNHDFDNGVEGLAKQIGRAKFPLLNCNYDFNGTELENKIPPYTIMKKGGLKIGILGVGIKLQGLVPDKLCEGIVYHDPIEAVNVTAELLKKTKRCDYVICLSHLGFEYKDNKVSDKVLAAESEHIDCILGGHTHTFLEEPHKIKNRKSQEVLVNQVGWAGINLGRINIYFNNNKRKDYTSDFSVVKMDNSWI